MPMINTVENSVRKDRVRGGEEQYRSKFFVKLGPRSSKAGRESRGRKRSNWNKNKIQI